MQRWFSEELRWAVHVMNWCVYKENSESVSCCAVRILVN